MRLIELTCDHCGATLELDPDRLQAYCQFCGNKLMIDMNQLSDVLKEKEKTKQVIGKQENYTKRDELKYQYKKSKDRKELMEMVIIIFSPILIILSPLLLLLSPFIVIAYFVIKNKKK